jgi:hypothetical protein
LATFERLGDATGQALVCRSIGQHHLGRYEVVSATDHLDAALRLWPAERQDAELASLMLSAARARVYAGEWDTDHRLLVERAVALAGQLGDATLLARALIEPPGPWEPE